MRQCTCSAAETCGWRGKYRARLECRGGESTEPDRERSTKLERKKSTTLERKKRTTLDRKRAGSIPDATAVTRASAITAIGSERAQAVADRSSRSADRSSRSGSRS
eukprot:6143510-Pleurochrysis_carterae.AAC.1